MGNKKRKNTTSFLAQGTILAAASLISRVIGLIYRMPATALLGIPATTIMAVPIPSIIFC